VAERDGRHEEIQLYRTVVIPLDPKPMRPSPLQPCLSAGRRDASFAGRRTPDVDALKPYARLAELIERHGIDAEALVERADDVARAIVEAAGAPTRRSAWIPAPAERSVSSCWGASANG
jgi:hypothetical protein